MEESVKSSRPYQIAVDLGHALHTSVTVIAKETNKTKAEVVRSTISHAMQCNSYNINKLTSSKRTTKKRINALHDEYHYLIGVWREVFSQPKRRVFYPAIKKCVAAATKGGLSKDDLEACIRAAPRLGFLRKQMNEGYAPPLSQILSEGVLPHLLQIVPDESEPDEDLDGLRRVLLDKYWDVVFPEDQDAFRDNVMQAYPHEFEEIIKHWVENA